MIHDDSYYQELGLRAGLEIHQQLLTPGKLFCRCPTVYRKDEPDIVLLRHMRPTLSEMGTYDRTALMEFKTRKQVHYELYNGTTCTYEMDDTPPFEIDKEAIDISLLICKQMDCNMVDELHITRKQYLDGTIPTGFQRTGILGIAGKVPYTDGRHIGITQISIEEDACREMGDRGHEVWFRTDRLSIPLVEVVTDPDMRTPYEVFEVARLLGRLMRVNRRVRRGSGATRQDVNVSIRGAPRIEIKGVSRLNLIAELVANEAERQKSLLKIRDELVSAGATEAALSDDAMKAMNVTHLFGGRGILNIDEVLEEENTRVMAVRLPFFAGLLSRTTHVHRDVAHEFEGRLKVIACLDNPVKQINTDSMVSQGIPQELVDRLRKELDAGPGDAVMVIWSNIVDSETAVNEIRARAREMTQGVPEETRQAFRDGSTGFERLLPGPDRMYPDTDSPPHPIDQEQLAKLTKELPQPPWDVEKRLVEKDELPFQIAFPLVISKSYPTYERLVADGITPIRAAVLLEQIFKYHSRLGLEPWNIPYENVRDVLLMHEHGEIALETVEMIIRHLAIPDNPVKDPVEAINVLGLEPASSEEVESAVKSALDTQTTCAPAGTDPGHMASRVMGSVMNVFRGRFGGNAIYDMVEKAIRGTG